MKNFVALDFETANSKRTSACAIGLAFVENGEIVKTEHYYIKPTPNYYEDRIVQIHGITAKDTDDKPTFVELWNSTLKNKLAGQLIVCHNASFDMSVLRALMCEFNISISPLRYLCTLVMSKIHVYELENYKLPTVSSHFGYDCFKHHDAAADAQAAAFIMIEICKQLECENYNQLTSILHISEGIIEDHINYTPCSSSYRSYSHSNGSISLGCRGISQNNIDSRYEEKNDRDNIPLNNNIFADKIILLTGNFEPYLNIDISEVLDLLGGFVFPTLSENVDYVIIGSDASEAVIDHATMLSQSEGKPMIITESDMIQIFDNYHEKTSISTGSIDSIETRNRYCNSRKSPKQTSTYSKHSKDKEVFKPNFDAVENKSNPFFKKKIVVTGTFINFPDRIELQKQLKSLGADINTSVSAKTDFVILGQSPGWSKMSKIEKYNITTISESQLMSLYSQAYE